MRIKLLVAYDGTGFSGWQRQRAGLPTIQQSLEDAVFRMNGDTASPVWGASRTDAGVHAEGQVAVFDTAKTREMCAWISGLNQLTPAAVRVRHAEVVADDFHPRHASRGKHYRYLIWQGRWVPPALRSHLWQVRPLDIDAMAEGAGYLLGEHDFSAFRASDCQASSPIRRMHAIGLRILPSPYAAPLAEERGALLALDFWGSAFLKHMIRIVVGSLVEVGEGRRPAAWVGEVLASRERCLAGRTAVPGGLSLLEVYFSEAGLAAHSGVVR